METNAKLPGLDSPERRLIIYLHSTIYTTVPDVSAGTKTVAEGQARIRDENLQKPVIKTVGRDTKGRKFSPIHPAASQKVVERTTVR